jgi:hypothetical protein
LCARLAPQVGVVNWTFLRVPGVTFLGIRAGSKRPTGWIGLDLSHLGRRLGFRLPSACDIRITRSYTMTRPSRMSPPEFHTISWKSESVSILSRRSSIDSLACLFKSNCFWIVDLGGRVLLRKDAFNYNCERIRSGCNRFAVDETRGYPGGEIQSNRLNSSGEIPACRKTARSVPVSSSEWSGMTTWAKGESRRKIMWLPCCRLKTKPILARAETHARPEIRGSLVILPVGAPQVSHSEPLSHPPGEQEYSLRWPREYFESLLLASSPG